MMSGYHEYIPMVEGKTPEIYINKSTYNLPESYDWRQSSNMVTPVKNVVSADCQAGYAAAAADAIESAYAIAGKTLT